MPKPVSVDEYVSKRAAKNKGVVVKGMKAPASWDENRRSATFVMSKQIEDRDGDIIYTAGIDLTEFMKNPQALLFHSSRNWPVGLWENVEKKPRELVGDLVFIEAGVDEGADKAAAMVKAGVIRACSIGFMPKTIKRRELENGQPVYGYDIEECELYECSVVTVPANPAALVKATDVDPVIAREIIEEVLDNWAKTPDGLLVPRSEFERAYKLATNDAKTITVTIQDNKPESGVGHVAGVAVKECPELPETADEETKSTFAKLWSKIFGSGNKQEKQNTEPQEPAVDPVQKEEIFSRARASREKAQALLEKESV